MTSLTCGVVQQQAKEDDERRQRGLPPLHRRHTAADDDDDFDVVHKSQTMPRLSLNLDDIILEEPDYGRVARDYDRPSPGRDVRPKTMTRAGMNILSTGVGQTLT